MYLGTFVPLFLCIFVPLFLWTFGSLNCWTFQDPGFGIQESELRVQGNAFHISIVFQLSLDLIIVIRSIVIQVSKFVKLYYNYTINFLVVILAVLHSIVPWNLCTFVSLYVWTFVSLDLWIFGSLDCWEPLILCTFVSLNLWIVGPFRIQDSGFRNRIWEFKEAPSRFQLYFNYLLI